MMVGEQFYSGSPVVFILDQIRLGKTFNLKPWRGNR
jgi:hypothetical protein